MSISKTTLESAIAKCSNLHELSKTLNISYNEARSLIKTHNLVCYPRGQRRKDETNRSFRLSKEDIIKYYCTEELSLRQIASIAGVSFQAVHSWLLAYNIPLRKRGLAKQKVTSTLSKEEDQSSLHP